VSTPIADAAANRRRHQIAPSARRAGWISIGVVVFLFSAIFLATQPGDDSINSDAGTAAAELHVPGILRVVALFIGWDKTGTGDSATNTVSATPNFLVRCGGYVSGAHPHR
jgi:hypothetical protein